MSALSIHAPGQLSIAQLESELGRRTTALESLTQQLLKVQDEERRRVARDLHDTAGQTLSAIKMCLGILQKKLQQHEGTSELVSEIDVLADLALQEIRTTAYLLHPPMLDEAGFSAAAQWYVDGFAKRSGIAAKCDFPAESQSLPTTIETALFRVLQEGLTNVHRYSGSSEVSVRFQRTGKAVALEITDVGCGIPSATLHRLVEASAETGVGLAGMRERLSELNGKLEIESGAAGTSLRAIVPIPALEEQAHWESSRSSK